MSNDLSPIATSRRRFLRTIVAGAAVAVVGGLLGFVASRRPTSGAAQTQSVIPSLSPAPTPSPASRRKAQIIPDVPRDAIPPLDFPKYERADEAEYLGDNQFVIGFAEGEDVRAYPFLIMTWHEIVNDRIGGKRVVVTYCPLCRSGIVFDPHLDGQLLTFGNTGSLYESDLVMYDRQTESYWWQSRGEAIQGPMVGKRLAVLPSLITTWGEWKKLHPNTLVLSRETGFSRPYEVDVMAGYFSGNTPEFPVSFIDKRLPVMEVVIGLELNDETKAYSVRMIGDAAVEDIVGDVRVVIFSKGSVLSANVFNPFVDENFLT